MPEQPVETPMNTANENVAKKDEMISVLVTTESIEIVGDAAFIPPVTHKKLKNIRKQKTTQTS